jgi:hypothetical protein
VRVLQRSLMALGAVTLGAALVAPPSGAAATTTLPGGVTLSLSSVKRIALGVSARALIRVGGLSGPSVVTGSLLRASGPVTCGTQTASTWAVALKVKTVSADVSENGAYTLVAGVPGPAGCYAWSVDLYVSGVLKAQVTPGVSSEVEVVARATPTTVATTTQPSGATTTTQRAVTTTTQHAVTTTTRVRAPATTTTTLITDTTQTTLPVASTLPGVTTTLAASPAPRRSSDAWIIIILVLLIAYFAYDILLRRRRR